MEATASFGIEFRETTVLLVSNAEFPSRMILGRESGATWNRLEHTASERRHVRRGLFREHSL